MTACDSTDLLVFSHLRWDFIFQRPHHILSRYGKYRRVYYFEEPVFGMTEIPRIHIKETNENVLVVVPHLPSTLVPEKLHAILSELIDELIYEEEIIDFTLWYYSPLALEFSRHLTPKTTIFDCMDELSSVYPNSDRFNALEKELLEKADLVFMGGFTLFESKKHLHKNMHPFPSSIDFHHFSKARQKLIEPDDQIHIPHPRIGFYGLIDQRINLELIHELAKIKPHYQFIVAGPIINIDKSKLPQRNNIHFLEKKDYHVLPLYLAGWDCAMMPYHLNESTQYASPTNTLEFLAAGRPIVSTSLKDVVHPYQKQKLVHIADTPHEFGDSIDFAMKEMKLPEWIDRVDHYLKDNNWDNTFSKMSQLELTLMTSTKHNFNDGFYYEERL